MKDKIRYLQIILLIGLMISTPAMAEWETYCNKDELTDKVSGGVSTYSLPDNPSSKINPILLTYNDMPYGGKKVASEFRVFSSKGFPSSDWDLVCGQYGCAYQMYLTSKFNKDTKARELLFNSATKSDEIFSLNTLIYGGKGFKKRIRKNDDIKIRIGGEIHTFLVSGLDDAVKKLRSSCDGVKGIFHIKL